MDDELLKKPEENKIFSGEITPEDMDDYCILRKVTLKKIKSKLKKHSDGN